MLIKLFRTIIHSWTCKCGKVLADDRNFCMYCDRERPPGK